MSLNLWAYKILKTKGIGGYGHVHKAVNHFNGQIVAIKELRNPTTENRRRFKRESDMLTIYKDSPYFPDLYQSILDCPEPFLVMEYSSKGSLENYVGRLTDWKRGARWCIDIAHALDTMEARKDLHRDLKPGNLLLFPREGGGEIVKLIDFGLAHRPDNPSGPATNSVYGTKGYIDPTAEKTGSFFKEADIYSLGRTMKALFTGNPDGTWFHTIPGPVGFGNLIESMTDFDVRKRPTARQIYLTLEGLLRAAEQPVVTPASISLGTIAKIALGALAVVALAKSNTWDDNVERYRDSKGQFASGLF
jgi:serine/threonine protein kinase